MTKAIDIKSDRLSMCFCVKTGNIVQITDRKTGFKHVDLLNGGSSYGGRLFRFIVPVDNWDSRYADSSDTSPVIEKQNDDCIVLTWRNLKACDGNETGVYAQVKIERSSMTDEILFSLDIDNHGDGDVTDVTFPMISGWSGTQGQDMFTFAGDKKDPYQFPRNTGKTYGNLFQKDFVQFPVVARAPWYDLSGPNGGISYLNYMQTPLNGAFCMHNQADHEPGFSLEFGWNYYLWLRPGDSWKSPKSGFSVHDGDWHKTADRYRCWVDTWFEFPPAKRSLRESIGFQNVWLRGFDGTPFNSLSSIPAIAEDGRKYGVDHLCIWDYMILGNYEKMNNLDLLDYSQAEKEILKAGLLQAKDEGTNVNALINFRLSPMGSSLAEERIDEVLRCLDGSPRTELYAASHSHMTGWTPHRGPNCYVLSSASESYCKRVLKQTREYLDLGFVSMFYDQPFEFYPDYHRRDEGWRVEKTYAAVISLVKKVRGILHENNPDSYMIGEYSEAFMAQYIDMWMSWFTNVDHAVSTAYAIPQTMNSWVVDKDIEQANIAFASGMYLCLCTNGNEGTIADAPEFGEHVAKLAALRKQCAERTVHARFNDTCGLRINSSENMHAFSFDHPDGPAVIVAAGDQGGKATVEVDREYFSGHGTFQEGAIYHLDGSESDAGGDARQFELEANDVKIWVL